MRIRYLVPKEYICIPEKKKDITLQQSENNGLPADIRLKHIDAARTERLPIVKEVRSKPSEMDVTYFPKTLRHKASWLLSELTVKGLKWNERGEIFHNDKIMPGTNILELTNDVLRERKNSNPQGWQHFARLLHNYNIPKNLIQNPKRMIMTPPGDLSHARDVTERADLSDDGSVSSLIDFEDMFT